MKKILWLILTLLFCGFVLISIINIVRWYKWYVDKRKVSFVIDIDFFVLTNNDVEKIVSQLNKLGINLFAIDIENFVLIKDKIFDNNKFVLKIQNQKIYDVRKIEDVIDKNKDKFFSIVYLKSDKDGLLLLQKNFYGRKISQDEINKFFDKLLLSRQDKLFKLNFEQQDVDTKINFVHTNLLPLRSFLCDLNQTNFDNNFSIILLKVKKAVFERSCSIIYILPSEYLDFYKNIEIIKSLLDKFTNNTDFSYQKFSSVYINKIFNFIVVIIAIVFPLVVFKKILSFVPQNSVYKIYFFVNILTIVLGILIWGFLQKYEYVAKEEVIYGTKLMFVIPIIFSFFVVLDKDEKNFLLNYNLTIRDVLISILLLTIFVYLLVRTGNVGKEFVLKFELNLREQIEKYVLFRPRFKEIFFAQPLFVFSIYLIKKCPKQIIPKILFCFSIIALVSIINTFLHVHTPIWICVLRSVIGIVLGWLFGKICLLVFTKIYKERIVF
jgi:hypothetical protein